MRNVQVQVIDGNRKNAGNTFYYYNLLMSLLLNELYNKLLISGRLSLPHLKYPQEASRGVTEEVDKITAHENNENLNS